MKRHNAMRTMPIIFGESLQQLLPQVLGERPQLLLVVGNKLKKAPPSPPNFTIKQTEQLTASW